ncbi:exodeoxyribonuclease V subunit gamma [Pseudoxanthomonas broegbernensis]|uniref:RecBCD enzyme subunit RecC n=1 Tax=Pseudoxanthomonas broegbernensis TaxID=83619 RepID=A0A7V8GN79_9GAMM|nr:exodeoxyribonuclease V subunit gamma [Pseudoxanthomonas broegbernensis]KAF1686875.1 exodeoxyribonuclease V subunit gamma [Pseudoxanthomonas broegbernensis]MBB6065533.1 exodeoxyribonuclease V gamma subunit [Pseudoxanthomonas broegbernensis]
MPAAPPDFRLYHSNSLEVLAGLLAQALREPVPGQSPLAPDIVLIPQVAMRRWLQAHLAATHGVVANVEFLAPGQFVAHALAANLGAGDDDLDAAGLHWRLYAALTDRALLAQPAMARLAGYLAGADPLKPWTLARELASVFEKYQAWRRDWLLRWEAGADPDDPQAILWRRVATGLDHRARRIQAYLERFAGPERPLPQGLPPRLFAFATLNVSPDVLRVLATQARAGTLHFYLPTPTQEYWGDLQALGARLRAGAADPFGAEDQENPLLRAWGAAGRDFMALLGSYEAVHPSGEIAAYADPEAGPGGSLLRRLQADLFHRRAQPGAALRPQVEADDPSLQLHACHTRLRELQVLHDRLRALLEDPRFDPPLQPRQIAVMAPDIDPYVPYLDAVFGGHGQGDPIPWAVADASPLAGEPLAAAFLRLLALPVSRFGLDEVLDLLASPPLAEAAGLDAATLERLRGWLHAAGARWGLDAAHRGRHGAPQDDAYTWQFAVDRLLLGHATGDPAPVAGPAQAVAPLPALEGGALDALDLLLRLLRVLARYERALAEAMPPARWRERLLGLLEALVPHPPSTPRGQRALDRLRTLIDAFASEADKAGFEAPVPGEAVRAHFAAALGEADTRAPLLTGGVSFARMVPMRLLPFRVICLLGMDDGQFPRRDPAAGLNRLTAELGTQRRRHGDRSTRDDDRYLFLQLFASAQDVFYLSWLGADPRDGSAREPSVLVSELIEAAAAQHLPDADAARALVLRHPLQPFSPAAFGAGGDPRQFSYQRPWRAAAAGSAAARAMPPPWFAGDALEPAAADASLPVEALRRFLLHPAEAWLKRLGLRLAEAEARGEDVEPLVAPGPGLERARLQRAVFDTLLQDDSEAAIHADLRARGLLPSGAPGRRVLASLRRELAPYADAFGQWRGQAQPRSLAVETTLDGVRLHGRIGEAYPQGIARLRFGKPNGPATIRSGLDWLLASAAGIELPLAGFHEGEGRRLGPHLRPPLAPEAARAALRRLLELRAQGLREPLPFAPYSAWELFSAPDPVRGVKAAATRWHGNGQNGFAEGRQAALRLALRGLDPFADPALLLRFADLAMSVFAAVQDGEVHAGVDPGALAGLAAAFDAEDAG